MRVRMLTTLAGPLGTSPAGTELDLADTVAHEMIAGRYAVALESAEEPAPEAAEQPPVETAAASAPETAEAPANRRRRGR
jgi:hypothetical protein